MNRIISLFLLSVYIAFVAGTLFSASEDGTFIYHSSEFKGKYHSSSDDGLAFVSQQADAKKIQKHLPFTGKIKLTRPAFATASFNTTSARHESFARSHGVITEKPEHASISLYLMNRILLI